MEQKDICSICSASKTCKVKYFQLEDAIRPPDDLHFDGLTELNGVLGNILNIKGKDRKATNEICQKCRDKLHGIYSFTHQHTKAEKIFHQITDVTVRLKKLKTLFLLTNDRKKEFGVIAESDKNGDSPECSSTVCDNPAVSGVVVKMECDNNFEGVDFNKAIKDQNVKYSNAADSRSVEQKKIDSMVREDVEQITIEDEIIKEEWTMQENDIFETKTKFGIVDREQTKFSCDMCDEEFTTVLCLTEHTKNVHEIDLHEFSKYKSEEGLRQHKMCHSNALPTYKCDYCNAKFHLKSNLRRHRSCEPMKCSQCNINCCTKPNLWRHLKMVHPNTNYICDQCGAKYKNKSTLKVHKLSHSGMVYKCDECDAKYKSVVGLRQHKMSHTDGLAAYKCDYCNAKFHVKSNFIRHRRCGKSLKCPQCNVNCCTKPNLWRHLKMVHPITNLLCDQCGKEFKTKQGIRKHRLSHSGMVYKCDRCDIKYKSVDSLRQHKLSHTNILPAYKCDYCNEKFHLKSNFRRHKSSKSMKCPQCNIYCCTKWNLRRHLKMVHPNTSYVCDQCGAKFENKRRLTVHKLSHSGKVYKCDQCDAKYKYVASLRQHKISHTNILPVYKCDFCNAKFHVKSAFRRHRRRESMKCPQCHVNFCTKPNLWRHLKMVHPITNYFCDQCEKEFKTMQGLREHKLSHTGVTFTCNECDASFSNRRTLTAHLRKVHKVAVFSCDQCETICKSKQDLNDHKLNHNGVSYNCDKCERSFSNCRALRYHKNIHHLYAN